MSGSGPGPLTAGKAVVDSRTAATVERYNLGRAASQPVDVEALHAELVALLHKQFRGGPSRFSSRRFSKASSASGAEE